MAGGLYFTSCGWSIAAPTRKIGVPLARKGEWSANNRSAVLGPGQQQHSLLMPQSGIALSLLTLAGPRRGLQEHLVSPLDG